MTLNLSLNPDASPARSRTVRSAPASLIRSCQGVPAMEAPSNLELAALAFVTAINSQDPSAIVARCTSEHVFVDSLGNHVTGADRLQEGWEWYFALFPDYRIDVEALALGSDCVLLSGWASATHAASGAKWRIPAAWRAIVAGDHISHWQGYADNKPVYEILSRNP